MLSLSITALLLLLMVLGAPVAFALAIAGAVGLYLIGGLTLLSGILTSTTVSAITSYELITVPMFLLMAEFVVLSGVAHQLFHTAAVWTGRLPGGLGVATAFAGAGFGAICGSSTAAAATLSSTSFPAMIEHRYDPRMAAGVVAISGTLAMLIPPSVALILYGFIADLSIGRLLIAGILPGVLVAATIAATVMLLAKLNPGNAAPGRRYSLREKLESLKVAGPVLLLFLMVTGIIYGGIATPTEASGLGAFGALLLAASRGTVTWASLKAAVLRATGSTCMIFLIILGAKLFGYFFTLTQVTPTLVSLLADSGMSAYLVLIIIIAGYILLGCFLDQLAILIITVPVVLPVILQLGFDPIWFGVIVIVVAEVGLLTPPLGINTFVVAKYTNQPLGVVFAGILPHILAHLVAIAILIIFPAIVLWLPSTMD